MQEIKNQLEDYKNSTVNILYLPVLTAFEGTTNLSKIREKLGISGQLLNYYIRELKRKGLLIQKGRGWYEPVKDYKNSTVYDNFLKPDFIRGHAYVWSANLPHEIQESIKWKDRINILKSNGIHFTLVGALKNIPRIKLLGRKVWLCNNHLRIFDKPNNSYYGQDAKQARYSALNEVQLIVEALNNKLGVNIRSLDIEFRKEHYALIKNDLAIEHNKKGEQLHISDKFGEWLLIDDSLGQGGELENIGKKAFKTNIPMQKWWNNHKEHNFKVTPEFVLERFNQIAESQERETIARENFAVALNRHIPAYEGMEKRVNELTGVIRELKNIIKKRQTKLTEW